MMDRDHNGVACDECGYKFQDDGDCWYCTLEKDLIEFEEMDDDSK